MWILAHEIKCLAYGKNTDKFGRKNYFAEVCRRQDAKSKTNNNKITSSTSLRKRMVSDDPAEKTLSLYPWNKAAIIKPT